MFPNSMNFGFITEPGARDNLCHEKTSPLLQLKSRSSFTGKVMDSEFGDVKGIVYDYFQWVISIEYYTNLLRQI